MRWICLGLAVTACGNAGTDVDLYTRALSGEGGMSEALDACAQIVAPTTRGDCQVGVLASYDRLVEADCQIVSAGLWRDECLFLLAERQRAAGDLSTAISTCHRTRFSRSCSWHLLQDEVEASLSEAPEVAERRLVAFEASTPLPDAGPQFWAIRFREQGGDGIAADEVDCDRLIDRDACRQGLWAHVRTMLDARGRNNLAGACDAAPGERVTVRGLPAWVMGEWTRAAEDRWVFERCHGGPPPP